jgi:hypothetical protein
MVALSVLSGSASAANNPYIGSWAYKQTCGPRHAAEIRLTQSGEEIVGDWSDGTRSAGSDGHLKGQLREGKLVVRYCSSDERGGYAVCPSYEAQESDYFVRADQDLVWFRQVGAGNSRRFERYLVLHPVVGGKASVMDSRCTSD